MLEALQCPADDVVGIVSENERAMTSRLPARGRNVEGVRLGAVSAGVRGGIAKKVH